MTATAQAVADLDPHALLLDANIRKAAALDPAFVESIRDHGVLVPIVAVETEQGMRVRFGQRRVLAAIDAGRGTVPVVVVDDAGDDALRIAQQWAENERRANLSTADKVAAVEQLALLGYTADDIDKRTRSSKADVDQALATANSKLAKKSAERYEFLDLEQAAAIAEFDGEKDTVKALVAAAQKSRGDFAHTVQRARDAHAEAKAIAELSEKLKAAGVRILTNRPDVYSSSATTAYVSSLVDAKGKAIGVRTHAKCEGHAAYIRADWRGVEAEYFCLDWKRYGHKGRYGSTGSSSTTSGKSSEAAKQERREVIANNKAWRSAEAVRRQWLTTFLRLASPPKGAAVYVAGELSRQPYQLTDHRSAELVLELLGVGADTRAGAHRPIDATLATASDQRAQVITLGIVLGSIEAFTGPMTWRGPSDVHVRYFTFLEQNGYALSDVEKLVTKGRRSRA
jgi:ParB family chromosome partitioning protein